MSQWALVWGGSYVSGLQGSSPLSSDHCRLPGGLICWLCVLAGGLLGLGSVIGMEPSLQLCQHACGSTGFTACTHVCASLPASSTLCHTTTINARPLAQPSLLPPRAAVGAGVLLVVQV